MTRWEAARIEHAKRIRGLSGAPVECELCGRQPSDTHHAIVRRKKGWEEYLDVPENCALLCHACHMRGDGDTREFRAMYWNRQIERGYDMEAWARGLPLKSESARAEILSLGAE